MGQPRAPTVMEFLPYSRTQCFSSHAQILLRLFKTPSLRFFLLLLSHTFFSTSLAVVFSLLDSLRARDRLQKNKQHYELYASKCSKKANINTSKLLGMANTLRMWTTLSAMESYFPVIWVHPWVYRHGIVETSSSCTTKGCMQVSLRPSSLVRKRVYNWASATKGANRFPRWPPRLADILRPVYSHFSPD